jgi:bifunctional non-homologous end joining protein LigD
MGQRPSTSYPAVVGPPVHADAANPRPRALPPPRLDLRGEGRRWRIIAYKDGQRVRLISRHGVDHTNRFSDSAAAISNLSARTLVIDGEVTIYDEHLRSRFDWLREPDPGAIATPPLYMVFDLLQRDGRYLTARPLRDRRARLEDIVAGSEFVLPVRRLAPDGVEAWRQVIERGYDGYVAKDEASLYEAGRTRRWLKVKQKRWTVEKDGWRRRTSVVPSA